MQENLVKQLAKKLYSLFVINTRAAGLQKNDGNYITRYIPVTEDLIENMLVFNGSIGLYQQMYKNAVLRWICLDFDCKEKDNPPVDKLYLDIVSPLLSILKKRNIYFLTEFSGRRGIHVWVIFDHIISKRIGYQIIQKIYKELIAEIGEKWLEEYNLDLFPKTETGAYNKVGLQVKCPLSCHKKGGRSYFFEDVFSWEEDVSSDDFLSSQLSIIENYTVNNVETILKELDISNVNNEISNIYKTYNINNNISISAEEAIRILSKTKVYTDIFDRLRKGLPKREDWFVLLGTFFEMDPDGNLLKSILTQYPVYDEQTTDDNINRISHLYHPATFGYLYRLYDLEIETELNADDTGYSFLMKEKGLEFSEKQRNVTKLDDSDVSIEDVLEKEKGYFLYNDEVINIQIWNELRDMQMFDLYGIKEEAENIEKGERSFCENPQYRVYIRQESQEKKRKLVSLSAYDRLLTTYLILKFYLAKNCRWKSYSYHLSFLEKNNLFYSWYTSWQQYQSMIYTFLNIPFLGDMKVITIDLKGFYDHVDFLAYSDTLIDKYSEKQMNIIKYLMAYNDCLMSKINHSVRIGVPQGPAYARVIAELFLDSILNLFTGKHENELFLYRYVDDIVIFCRPNVNDKLIYEEISDLLLRHQLPINNEKSKCYGRIRNLKESDRKIICHSDKFSYELSSYGDLGYKLDSERLADMRNYFHYHPVDMEHLSYILSKKNITESKKYVIEKYGKELIGSETGRGIAFRRLYEEFLGNENWRQELINIIHNTDFFKYPINYSNFISVLYLKVQDHTLSIEMLNAILNALPTNNKSNLNEDDRHVLEALRMVGMYSGTEHSK